MWPNPQFLCSAYFLWFMMKFKNRKKPSFGWAILLCLVYVLECFAELFSLQELQMMTLLGRYAFWNFSVWRRICYRNLFSGSPALKLLSHEITMVSTVPCDLTLSIWRYHVSCLSSHMWFLNDSWLSRSV